VERFRLLASSYLSFSVLACHHIARGKGYLLWLGQSGQEVATMVLGGKTGTK
jgi:hypothetical protein